MEFGISWTDSVVEQKIERRSSFPISLHFHCALIVVLSGTLLAVESTDKKVQGVRKAIDVCIDLLEKRDFEGFVNHAVHPSKVKDIKKTDATWKKCLDGLIRDRDELLAALKASRTVEPVFRKSVDPKEEDAFLVLEKPIFKDRELRYFIFSNRDGIWYFLA